jgi:hypothetical protein
MEPNPGKFAEWLGLGSIVLLLTVASAPQAASLTVVGGVLQGASGVVVGGSLYNVQFHSGACISLFDGCDSVSDFAFNSFASAELASQALLDQVFLDTIEGAFDSQPELISGCTAAGGFAYFCSVYTPYSTLVFGAPPVTSALLGRVLNYPLGGTPDVVTSDGMPIAQDTTEYGNTTYAVWTVVPEPGTSGLVGLALVSVLVGTRRIVKNTPR